MGLPALDFESEIGLTQTMTAHKPENCSLLHTVGGGHVPATRVGDPHLRLPRWDPFRTLAESLMSSPCAGFGAEKEIPIDR
jgi:hypothetical protein